mmetsp:Transcript_41099/g.64189  ORF Transcript_41099/g.64189 Transcript_41099/m.64189 type:complete len:218 (-) Transcript_41099:35-688(-)|eukprot:CAMPEP_0184299236 /NCGR_PEP_ID=MMETSP1049-20130417/9889_1 /TAXON_ID=77928 /ORGANISM="Proteomonas sulcata, Strain CCMP704" /LENGTH=217 /DNA_ID=CAMNT_0026609609 /DNA_START=253 /DNA_END=906 /DNA_ORIENTATION=+
MTLEGELTSQSVVEELRRIVGPGVGPKQVHVVVRELYKANPLYKEYIKDTLQSTVLDILKQHPQDFVLLNGSMVQHPGGFTWYTMDEVAKHCTKEDGWIVVEGEVYNISEFIRTHWGWNSAGKNSTIISIMSALGSDCTLDFNEIHHGLAMWPTIKEQLDGFRLGRVVVPPEMQGLRVKYHTWDDLVEMGRIPRDIMPVKDDKTRKWVSPIKDTFSK